MADVWVGRAPVHNEYEVDLFINKILTYERCSRAPDLPSTDYLIKMLSLAGIVKMTPWPSWSIGINTKEKVANYLDIPDAVTIKKLYEYDEYCDTALNFPYEEIDYEELSVASAISHLNEGYGIVNHADHSNLYVLGMGSFHYQSMNRSQADGLTNGNKYSVVYSAGCEPNAIDYNSIADHFMLCETGGAAAFVGPTRSIYITAGNHHDYEFFSSLFDLGYYHIGRTMGMTFYSSHAAQRHNLLGCPEMPIWNDEPDGLVVEHPDLIDMGPQQFTVTVKDSDNVPIDSALVCLQKGVEAYGYGFTDINGEITFDYKPESPGSISVTVTAKNFVPYEGTCTVEPITEAYICYSSSTVEDIIGNMDSIMNPGETINLPVFVKNTGNETAIDVTGELSTLDDFITIVDGIENFQDIDPGLESNATFIITINTDCPDDHDVNFELLLTDHWGQEWEDEFTLTALADSFEHTGHPPLSKKWDIFYLSSLEITNYGFGAGDSVTAILRSASPDVIVIDSISNFEEIKGRSVTTGEDRFSFYTKMYDPWLFNLIIRDRFQREWEYNITLYYPDIPINPPEDGWSPLFGQDFVDVNWSTCNEVLGYNVFRSESEYDNYERQNLMIIKGTATYHDKDLFPYTDYYYKVETVDSSGNRSELSDAFYVKTSPPYQVGWPVSVYPHNNWSSPVVGDMNGDGLLEVAVASGNKVYLWDSYGFNPIGWPIELSGDILIESSPALGDLNRDGNLEIVVSADSLYVWNYSGDPLSGWPQNMDFDYGPTPLCSPTLSDLNNDGYLEVIAGAGDMLYVWDHNGDLLPGWPIQVEPGITASAGVGNLDDDQELEIVIPCGWSDTEWPGVTDTTHVYVFNYDGSLSWKKDIERVLAASPAIGDINGDGSIDVVVGTLTRPTLYAWNSAGEELWSVSNIIGGFWSSPALVDLDGDDSLEIISGTSHQTASFREGYLYIWNCKGNVLNRKKFVNEGYFSAISSVTAGDIDGNEDIEIVFGAEEKGVFAVNYEDLSTVDGFPIPAGGPVFSSLALADVDINGDLEIVVCGSDERMYVWDLPTTYNPSNIEWGMFQHDRWRTGNYETEIIEKLLSTTNEATAYNNQRKLAFDSYDNLHLVYQADAGCYYTSSDDEGKTWTSRIRFGNGNYPCLTVNSSDEVSCCWIKEIGNLGYGLYYTDNFGTTTDTLLEEVGSCQTDKYVFAPPAMVIDGNDQIHVVVEVIRPILTEAQIRYRNFPVGNPAGGIPWETVFSYSGAETGDIASPSIDVDEVFNPHIVFERRWG